MNIQFNTDHNIEGSEAMQTALSEVIAKKMNRYTEQISRLEVHLTDENGAKQGPNDKKCTIEARLEGMKPVAVTAHANNHHQAVDGAVEKLKASLDTIIGRLRNH